MNNVCMMCATCAQQRTSPHPSHRAGKTSVCVEAACHLEIHRTTPV